MRRYMICPIVGDGSSPANAFRAAVADVEGVNVSSIIPTQGSPAEPKFNFAFCLVSAIDWVPVQQISNSLLFPDFALDAQMSGMEAVTRSALEQDAEAFDLDGAGLHLDAGHNSTDSYRHLLNAIGQQFDPAFTINLFEVQEAAVTPG